MSSETAQLGGEFTQGPVEVKNLMAAKKTYAKKKSEPRRVAAKPLAIAREDPAPVAAGIQSLFSLVSMMRTMNAEPAGSPLNPKVILSGSGVEVRFADSNGRVESVPAEMQVSPDQLLRIERSLKVLGMRMDKVEQQEQAGASEELVNRLEKELRELRQTNARLDEELTAQKETLEALRAAVEQNEQMMETLVDSMNMMDDLGDAGLGPELVLPSTTLAS
jgi:predicted RNase H-like nuclease (RuvC/YqgF family)